MIIIFIGFVIFAVIVEVLFCLFNWLDPKEKDPRDKPSLLLSDYIEMKITYCDICLSNIAKNLGEDPVCYNSMNCVYWNKDISEKCSPKSVVSTEDPYGDKEEKDFWKNFGEDNTE